MTNIRTEKIPAAHGGDRCVGKSTSEESCNSQKCPGGVKLISIAYFLVYIRYVYSQTHIFLIYALKFFIFCSSTPSLYKVDCKWNEWVNGTCSESCGGGIRINTRTIKNSESSGGAPCDGGTSIEDSCNEQECPGQSFRYSYLIRILIRFVQYGFHYMALIFLSLI